MLVLALDSTEPSGSCALWRDGVVLAERVGDATRTFSDRLPRDLLSLLDAQSLTPADVTLFAAGSGPGSLTGLRVGLATIQGFAFAAGRPAIGVSVLDAAAHVVSAGASVGPDDRIAAWFDARRGEVFTALYDVTTAADVGVERIRQVDGPAVDTPTRSAAKWTPMIPATGRLRVVTDTSDAALVGALEAAFGDRVTLLPRPPLAATIAALAAERARRGLSASAHALQPLYIRRPDAELARERRLAAPADKGHQA